MQRIALRALVSMLVFTGTAAAQVQPALPEPVQAPQPVKPVKPSPNLGAYDAFIGAGWTCGGGTSLSKTNLKPTVQCGGIVRMMPLFELEAGVMGPQASRSPLSGYLSTDFWFPIGYPNRHMKGLPLAVGGYTRMFETGHAINYGLAYAVPINQDHSIQFEARDYWTFAHPDQHNVVFRVVWLLGLPD